LLLSLLIHRSRSGSLRFVLFTRKNLIISFSLISLSAFLCCRQEITLAQNGWATNGTKCKRKKNGFKLTISGAWINRQHQTGEREEAEVGGKD